MWVSDAIQASVTHPLTMRNVLDLSASIILILGTIASVVYLNNASFPRHNGLEINLGLVHLRRGVKAIKRDSQSMIVVTKRWFRDFGAVEDRMRVDCGGAVAQVDQRRIDASVSQRTQRIRKSV